jgi:hypothetical protein
MNDKEKQMAERFTPHQATYLSGLTCASGLGPSGFPLPTENSTFIDLNLMDPGTPDQDLEDVTS